MNTPSPSLDGTDLLIPRIKALDLYAEWEAEFKPLLGYTSRWEGFSYIVRDQLLRERPVIVETGTLREIGNWAGDGCSTLLWNWILSHKDGEGYSIDTDVEAVRLARKHCPKIHVVWSDSVHTLRGIGSDVFKGELTLLYLDSYDYAHGKETNSCMHQVAELAAIWEKLPSGCLIASDDSHGKHSGKPTLTRVLLNALGIKPEIESYIVVWRKP